MKILFLGGDKRYLFMMENLSEIENIEVSQIGFNIDNTKISNLDISSLDLNNFDIVLFPISGLNDNFEIKTENGLLRLQESLFENLKSNIRFFTGLKTKKLLDLICTSQLTSFLDSKEVFEKNNSLTVDRCDC